VKTHPEDAAATLRCPSYALSRRGRTLDTDHELRSVWIAGVARVKLTNCRIILPLLALALAPTAWGAGWGAVLDDAAIRDFNDDDVRDYLATVYALLDAPLPAAPVEWSNPRTGSGAQLEVIGQPQGFSECRRVRTNVYSRKHKAKARTWTACRDDENGWRLVSGR
jgi:hypothetical protein